MGKVLVANIRGARGDDGVVTPALQDLADQADASKNAAVAAKTAAEAARDAAQAVGNTNDTIMASVAANSSSAFASQLFANVANSRARLASRAGYDAARSNGFAQAGQASATAFTEAWADTSAWAGAGVQVSAGKLFGTTGGGGIGHSFRVAPGVLARVTFTLDWVANGTSGQGILIGFARNTVGGSVPGGGSQSRGLYFRSTGTLGAIHGIDNGTQDGTALFQGFSNSTWVITATVDENWYSLVAVCPATNDRVVRRFARDDSTFPLNNLTIMMNDSRGLSGSAIRPITEARIGALATGVTTAGAVGGHWSSVDGDNIMILTPSTYDSRRPSPVAVLFHGNGSDETYWNTIFNGKAIANAFLAAGFIVVSAANTGAVSTWGSDSGLDPYTRAYQYTRDHYNTGAVVFYANSMGGIESLNVLARDAIPGVAAWVGTVPTYNLAENHSNALFTATIDAAYGGNFAVNAQGHDPAVMSPLSFRGIPMWMMIATDDTTVTPSANGYALYAAVAQTNPIVKVEVTGGHVTGQIATQAPTMASWAASQIGVRNTWAP